jgi:hypothetical protein
MRRLRRLSNEGFGWIVGYLRLAGVLFPLDEENPFPKSIESYQSYPGHVMDIAKMLAELRQEREQIEEAI